PRLRLTKNRPHLRWPIRLTTTKGLPDQSQQARSGVAVDMSNIEPSAGGGVAVENCILNLPQPLRRCPPEMRQEIADIGGPISTMRLIQIKKRHPVGLKQNLLCVKITVNAMVLRRLLNEVIRKLVRQFPQRLL